METVLLNKEIAKKSRYEHRLFAWLIAIYICFAGNSSVGHMVLFGMISIVAVYNIFKYKLRVKHINTFSIYVIFLLICIVSLLFIKDEARNQGLTFCAGAIIFMFVWIIVSNWSQRDIRYLFNCIFVFLTIFAVATFIQAFAPNLIDKICSIVLSDSALETNRAFVRERDIYGGLPGLTAQIGTNAFYMTLFVGICLIRFVYSKRKRKLLYLIGMSIGMFDLISTSKRGLLLFCCLMSVLIVVIYFKKQMIKAVVLCLFIGVAICAVLFLSDIGASMIEKFLEGGLSGREQLWANAWNEFLAHPILGMGVDSYKTQYGMDAHNIFLQILCETGFVGFILLIMFVVVNFIKIMRSCIGSADKNNRELLMFSLFVQGIFILWGVSGNTLYDQPVLCTYMVAIGIYYASKSHLRRKKI